MQFITTELASLINVAKTGTLRQLHAATTQELWLNSHVLKLSLPRQIGKTTAIVQHCEENPNTLIVVPNPRLVEFTLEKRSSVDIPVNVVALHTFMTSYDYMPQLHNQIVNGYFDTIFFDETLAMNGSNFGPIINMVSSGFFRNPKQQELLVFVDSIS